MSEVTKPILLDETGQEIVSKLEDIREAILADIPDGNPIRITVVSPPTKTAYVIGDEVDLTGIAVNAVFSNNVVRDITSQCTFSPDNGDMAIGDEITITWIWHPTEQIFTATTPIEVEFVSWSSGSAKELKGMLDAHYQGLINIYDYWTIGDTRNCFLSAMSAVNVGETHAQQMIELVLSEVGGKLLSDSETECAFQVDQRDSLEESGYMNSTSNISGGWKECDRRKWCNEEYRNSYPEGIKDLFKQLQVLSADQRNSTSTVITDDYFALRSEKELFGRVYEANATAENDLTQVSFYKISANRVKGYGSESVRVGSIYWERSVSKGTTYDFCFYTPSEDVSYDDYANKNYGISLFGGI